MCVNLFIYLPINWSNPRYISIYICTHILTGPFMTLTDSPTYSPSLSHTHRINLPAKRWSRCPLNCDGDRDCMKYGVTHTIDCGDFRKKTLNKIEQLGRLRLKWQGRSCNRWIGASRILVRKKHQHSESTNYPTSQQTDQPTDRPTDRQADRREADRHTDMLTVRPTGWPTDRTTDIPTGWPTDRTTDRLTDRRPTNRPASQPRAHCFYVCAGVFPRQELWWLINLHIFT